MIHVTAAAFGLMLTEALFRWSASAGQLGPGPGRSLGQGSLESSGSPGDGQKKPGKHEERICVELAACSTGGALAGSQSLLMASSEIGRAHV